MGLFVPAIFIPLSRDGWCSPFSVFGLFLHAGPSAVARFIAFAIVNSINRLFSFWRVSHIAQKICKTIVPTVANLDSFSPIIFVSSVFWIVASLFHANPTRIFWFCTAVCSVIFKCIASTFGASTTSASAIFYRLRCNDTMNSTNTHAVPINLSKLSHAVI